MTLAEQISQTVETLQALRGMEQEVRGAAELIVTTLQSGGRLLTCGNGGSAAEAAHLMEELVGRYRGDRRSLPAIALTSDGPLLSCIANDYGWETVFARQVAGLGRPGDLLVVLSSSGNSPNLLRALEAARAGGLRSLALLGRGGGHARGLADAEVIVPGESASAAQEAHLFLIHHFCEQVEAAFSRDA